MLSILHFILENLVMHCVFMIFRCVFLPLIPTASTVIDLSLDVKIFLRSTGGTIVIRSGRHELKLRRCLRFLAHFVEKDPANSLHLKGYKVKK